MITLSIDPGLSGALIAKINNDIISHYCPKDEIDMIDLIKEYSEIANIEGYDIFALIEKVHVIPVNGKISAWKLSGNFHTWKAALMYAKIPFKEVHPKVWMKALGDFSKNRKDRKNEIKKAMSKLYPQIKVTLKNADALGILTYHDENNKVERTSSRGFFKELDKIKKYKKSKKKTEFRKG